MYVLSVQYSCAVVSVFLFGGKANLVLLTLFYSTLLALTDRQRNDTLASRGLEEPFLQLFCCVMLVFGSCGILKKILGFQIPPIFCISHLAPPSKDTVICLMGAGFWRKKKVPVVIKYVLVQLELKLIQIR